MGGVLELDEVVTGLMKLRGPVSKAATRTTIDHRPSAIGRLLRAASASWTGGLTSHVYPPIWPSFGLGLVRLPEPGRLQSAWRRGGVCVSM